MYTHNAPDPFSARQRPGETIGREIAAVIPRTEPGTIDLLDALEQAWKAICMAYDVSEELPDTQCLLEGANPKAPRQAAETILANMLLEVIEHVGRFSPVYKKPIGLIHVRDRAHNRSHWLLSPELRQRWQEVLAPLAIVLEKNTGLIIAADVIGGLFESEPCEGDRVIAACACVPPHVILVNRAALVNADIVCDDCEHSFQIIEPPDD